MKRTTWQRCNKYCSRGSSEGTCSDDRAEQRMRMCRDGRGLGSKLVSFSKGRAIKAFKKGVLYHGEDCNRGPKHDPPILEPAFLLVNR